MRKRPPASRMWLLLVHQLPAHPSNLRVQTWRRLQQIGAIPVKQAVYVLPDTPAAREDFEWLKGEIVAAGGDASIFAAECIDNWSDDRLVDAFRRARQEAYATLGRDVERAVKRKRRASAPARARGQRVEAFRQKLSAIQQIDFFGGPGREYETPSRASIRPWRPRTHARSKRYGRRLSRRGESTSCCSRSLDRWPSRSARSEAI